MFASLRRLAGGLSAGGGRKLGERLVNTKGVYLPAPRAWDVAGVNHPGTKKGRKGRSRADRNFVECERAWHHIDAYGQVMGRLASKIVPILCGKHKPIYQGQRDVGDYVVVTNAAKVVLTGKKREQKFYVRHSGYPGGLKITPFEELYAKNPVRPLRQAIWGMMPKNLLKMQRMKRLRLFPGPEHDHKDQFKDPNPKAFNVTMPPNDAAPKFTPYPKLTGPD